MDDSQNPASFEEKLQAVQDMIAGIESGKLSLEESVLQYEKGIRMLSELDAALESMNRRITALHDGKETEIESAEL
jgi:exodeoxyribonuclease VII small subunit